MLQTSRAFTSSCLILSSSSHKWPSSTSIAFFITDAISLILSMCACISYKGKINTCKLTMFRFTSRQMGEIIMGFTDCGVLLLELAHNGRVVPFAGH